MDRLYTSVVSALLALLLTGVSGCKIGGFFDNAQTDTSALVAQYWDGPRVGPGMALCVQVGDAMTEPKVMNILVDQKGEIILPYLLQESIGCDGLGLEALKQKLIKAYSKYIRQPQVTVTFGPYDVNTGVSPWGTVKVMGEVANPGPVNMPPTMDLTVTKVLQLAGGVRPFADKRAILVTRCDKDGRQTRMKVDLDEIGKGGRSDKDILLKAGDVIFVPETWY